MTNVTQVHLSQILTPVQIRMVDLAHVARLAESMKRHGQEVPIVVHQPAEPGSGLFRLGPGRHRLEAARLLGWETIAAIVKDFATDAELCAEQVRENLERKDLTPLEEAELCAVLLDQVGGDVAQAAAIMGRPAKWVDLRVSLTRLSPEVRGLVLDGRLPLAHAQLIARVADHGRQEEIASQVAANDYKGQAQPLWRVKQMVEREGRSLVGVAWRMDAAFGSTNRACFACPQNSANSAGLFDDGAPKKATCLQASCYAEKSRLAGSGARRAATYLLNEGLKRSPAGAEQAAAAREAPFVATAAVLAAAKRTAELKKDRAEAKADGKPAKEQKPKAESPQAKLDKAEQMWFHEAEDALRQALKGKPLAMALLHLLEEAPGGGHYDPRPKEVEAVRGMLKKLGQVDGAVLLEAAKLVDARSGYFPLAYKLAPDAAEALGIKLKPRPTLESIKAELAKKAEADRLDKTAEKIKAKPTTKKVAKKKAT